MKTLATLPKPILLMEATGGLLLIAAGLLLHGWITLPATISAKDAATVALIAGIMLMLPAAWLMMWRTAKALAPRLFASSPEKKTSGHHGESHDADH